MISDRLVWYLVILVGCAVFILCVVSILLQMRDLRREDKRIERILKRKAARGRNYREPVKIHSRR